MRNKNSYIIFYTVALCVVAASVLAVTKQSLSKIQDENVAFDNKKKILNTVIDISSWCKKEIDSIYELKVSAMVIDAEGNQLKDDLSTIDVVKERSKPIKDRKLPLYTIKENPSDEKPSYFIFPTSGNGLWDRISSYVAMKNDGQTIKGISFDHVAETPGLGARIKSDPAIRVRYEGKKMYNEKSEPIAVFMVKGEGGTYDDQPHTVDGMSGATLTANGVNDMLKEYSTAYQKFFNNLN